MKMISEGTQVWRGAELAFFGPANSCPSALCQNMLGVHLDCCPRVSAPGWSCGCLHDNSRSGVNCCALSQMLLCTCGLIRRCSRPPASLRYPSQHTTPCSLLPSSCSPSRSHPQSVCLALHPVGLFLRSVPVALSAVNNSFNKHWSACADPGSVLEQEMESHVSLHPGPRGVHI